MRHCFKILLIMAMINLVLAGCGKNTITEPDPLPTQEVCTESEVNSESVIDLTALSSTMVFSQVYNIMISPEEYEGRTIKGAGNFQVYQDSNNRNFYALIISDAEACCQQGLELIWDGAHTYPEDYPEEGSEIEITGVFQSYIEEGNTYYYVLVNEVKEVGNFTSGLPAD